MPLTYLESSRSVATQAVAPFTGEGAYHGSTRSRAPARAAAPVEPVAEMQASSLAEVGDDGRVPSFTAEFANVCEVVDRLPVPSQAEIRDDAVSLCWCPLELALTVAGPLTRRVLAAMQAALRGDKRHVYVDSKIQYFEPGDVPVDSQHWHVDGSITVRGPAAARLGHGVVHDMKARLLGPAEPPRYLAYQSSDHCATLFASEPVTVPLPILIPNFDELDRQVRARAPACLAQPAGSIVRFDGRSLHRAVPASGAGWRLWVRCVETDRRVDLDADIIRCYGTVFRTAAAPPAT